MVHGRSSLGKNLEKNLSQTLLYEPRDINHTICFNEDEKKILLKLSKDISIHATLRRLKFHVINFGWITI